MMRHKSPTPEQLIRLFVCKSYCSLVFPLLLNFKSQMKALQKKLNENSTLIQKLNNTGFTVNSTWFTPQQVDLLFDEWGNPDYNIRKKSNRPLRQLTKTQGKISELLYILLILYYIMGTSCSHKQKTNLITNSFSIS